jgi:lipopolysaccharide/colanic/teichoic acid biosynthesis glycosyltransferase
MIMLLAGAYMARVFLSRLTLFYFGLFLFVGFLSLRCAAHAILGSRYLAKALRRVVIVGQGPVAREMAEKIERHPEMLCQVVGFLCSADTPFDSPLPGAESGAETLKTLGIIDLLQAHDVDEVIITLPNHASREVLNLAARFRRAGIGVSVVPHPYDLYLSKPQLIDIGGLPILQLREAKSRFADCTLKRTFDIVFGSILLVVCAPLILLGAIALLTKKGGPFVREFRCGQFGQPFWMYRLNSNRNCQELPKVERILQRISITEMPQFWNVVCGDMSLVGPRPESPERVKHYSEWQRQRLNIKPGMSGLAQVYGLRDEHSSEEKSRFDLQYMMHASPFFDFSLILQTGWTLIARVFRPDGLRAREGAKTPSTSTDRFVERTLPSAHSAQPGAD